jgi:hypothetical protein
VHRRNFVASLLTSLLPLEAAQSGSLVFCCSAENDLYRGLAAAGQRFPRFANPSEAIAQAAPDSGALILADGYPEKAVSVDDYLIEQARRRQIRLYVEYPSWLMQNAGAPRQARWERAVVTSDFFGPSLERLRILNLHECHFLAVTALREREKPHLVLAKVAGFDTAVYGLSGAETFPLLIEDPSRTLIATTKLSQFVTARYAPVRDWTTIWAAILGWLMRGSALQNISFEPAVHPAFGASDRLPPNADRDCFEHAVGWYRRARMLVHPSWADQVVTASHYKDFTGPGPSADWPVGDGSRGLLEGHASRVLPDGSQLVRWWIRADCVGETAMVHSLAHLVNHRVEDRRVASNLADYLLARSPISSGPRADPLNPAYGLLGWGETDEGLRVYYGDENARCLLGLITTSSILRETKWDERIWLAVLANFRLMGRLGHREWRHDEAPLNKNGWRYYHDGDVVLHDMNYQAYPWALFVWAYAVTGYRPFRDQTKKGIRLTMQAYPDHWRWTNSMTMEQARLLLALAWLVRVDDTTETRAWLGRVAADLLSHQDASGAIAEWIGSRETGIQMPPASNAEYGGAEGTLIQRNGDPATDMLYTVNFALIGLHEAAAATGDAFYRKAADKMCEFVVRVQAHSEPHPELHGAWFRGFDFRRWEYWASSTDAGWGAWSTESGWSQSWLSTVLGLRLLKRSLWDVIAEVKTGSVSERLRKKMLPE